MFFDVLAIKKLKDYEKRYLESNYSGGGEHTHSGIDGTGHYKLYAPVKVIDI